MRKARLGNAAAMLAAPALLAAIVVSYTAFWFYNAGAIKARLADWAAERRANGDAAAYVVEGVGGFPTRLALEISSVELGFRRGETTWRLTAPKLSIESGVFSPRAFSVALPDGSEFGRTRPDRTDTLRKLGGQARFDFTVDAAEGLRTAVFGVADLALGGSWGGRALAQPLHVAAGRIAVSAEPALVTAKNAAGPTARFGISLNGLRWPDATAFPLGPEVESFALDGEITGPITAGTAYAALKTWREAGGSVAIKRIGLHWGASALEGTGTLVLDARLQPAASLTARVEGFVPLVDVLETADLIRNSDATLARLVLGREMPKTGSANLSLSLRDGIVYAGPLALVRVPDVAWPGAPAPPPERNLAQPGMDIGRDGTVRRKGDPL